MVAAILCFCNEYNVPKPYAGIMMVTSMSDRSIRDFLLLMHEIYITENTSADKFARKRVNPSRQHKAIRNASEVRYERVGKEAEARTKEITTLVYSLGKITAEIQSAYNDSASLNTAERGIFDIDLSGLIKEERDDLKEILELAGDSHCIKILARSNKKILIRLHKLFAPKFGFSYRGAYYGVPLKADILLNLCKERNEANVEKMINSIIERIVKDDTSKVDSVTTLDRWSK